MIYKKVSILSSDGGLELITGLLLSMGIEETIVESGNIGKEILENKEEFHWDYVEPSAVEEKESRVVFYLEPSEEYLIDELKRMLNDLKENIDEELLGSCEIIIENVHDEDWINKYKEGLKPIFITENIVVKPTWINQDFAGKCVINLDPGMAFGTGDHGTTSMCAQLMEKYGCDGKRILDVGTGSGILSILAEKLNAKDIMGIDIDETAVDVAIENGKINKCERVKFQCGDLTRGVSYKADIVVANLMAEIVVLLSKSVREHIAKGGIFISSGILKEKEKLVVRELELQGFEILEVAYKDDWCAIVAK